MSVEHENDPELGIEVADPSLKQSASMEILTRVQRAQLSWRNLEYIVTLPSEEPGQANVDKHILTQCAGCAKPGRLLAVMGSSGAGKTTLLNALSGRLRNGTLSGEITVNGYPINRESVKGHMAYVTQTDVLMETQTPREIFAFAAKLRLPADASDSERKLLVENMIDKMHLNKVADREVGKVGEGGLSGGERKRVNIGQELITNPSLLFVDEPTSGLDSYTAEVVIRTLKELARDEGRTIISTIHQPSSEVFALFDDLLLMHVGQVAYFGEAKEACEFLGKCGYPKPESFNPADHIIGTLMKTLRQKEEAKVDFTVEFRGDSSRWNCIVNPDMDDRCTQELTKKNFERVGFASQFVWLAHRNLVNYGRNRVGMRARVGQTLFFATIIALIFINLKENFAGVQDRQGLLFFCAINQGMSALFQAVLMFPLEKSVFYREVASETYSTSAYFFSKTLSELPFQVMFPLLFSSIVYPTAGLRAGMTHFLTFWGTLVICALTSESLGIMIGSVAPDPQLAVAMTPAAIIPFFLTGGLFANRERLDPYWIWLEKLSYISYSFESLMENEFKDVVLNGDVSAPLKNDPGLVGNNVLDRMNFELGISTCLFALGMLTIGFRIIAFIGLLYTSRQDFSGFTDNVNRT